MKLRHMGFGRSQGSALGQAAGRESEPASAPRPHAACPDGAPSHERLAFAALLELPELLSGPRRQREPEGCAALGRHETTET